jgi:O-antigen/teichoic acid export membrane protein
MPAGILHRNVLWNLAGQCAPLAAAVFAFPLLVDGLGTDRFGVLSLAWTLIGYFSLFDLGVGRALTKAVAETLGGPQEDQVPVLAWTGLSMLAVLGLGGGVVLGLLSRSLVEGALKVPYALRTETLQTLYVLALSIPAVTTTAGLRGILEAAERFDLVNLIRIPMGVLTFLAPLLVLPFSRSLVLVVAALAAGRLVTMVLHLVVCVRVMPRLRERIATERAVVTRLLRTGAWMTVSNLVGPILLHLDRFLIGVIVSMAAVAYYTTPYEVVTKLLLIPLAVVTVLFPAFAQTLNVEPRRTTRLFVQGVKYVFLAMFPLALLTVTYAEEVLKLWLGGDFARNSAEVLQWLAIGVFVNSLAHIPFAMTQGVGRSDLTAKLHLLELPLYIVAAWLLVASHGIQGAAIAWTLRVVIDAIVLFVFARQLVPMGKRTVTGMLAPLACAFCALVFAMLPTSISSKSLFVGLTLAAFLVITWRLVLTSDERDLVRQRFS